MMADAAAAPAMIVKSTQQLQLNAMKAKAAAAPAMEAVKAKVEVAAAPALIVARASSDCPGDGHEGGQHKLQR